MTRSKSDRARFTPRQSALIEQALADDSRTVRTVADLTRSEAAYVLEYWNVNALDECEGPATWNCETDAQIAFAQRQFRKSIGALRAKIQQSFNVYRGGE